MGIVRMVLVLAGVALIPAAATADIHGVPLPSRSRPLGEGAYKSARGFRDTIKYYQRFLGRRGNRHREIPVYRYRGVTVARFLNEMTGGTWAAIHVFAIDGVTQIFVVPGAATLDEAVKPG